MDNMKKEQSILNFIKYGPILFVLTLSFIITKITLEDRKKTFEAEVKHIEEVFWLDNKQRIKEEVEEVYQYILDEKKNSESFLKEEIKNRVYEAHQIATNMFSNEVKLEKNHNHSQKYILESIKNALGGIIYNKGRGYIFMDDINGIKILQPLNKELEGKDLSNFQDAKGYKFVHKIVDTIKNKTEAYDTYYWYKSGNKEKSYKKISFYKYFEPFNVAIGTGEYLKDFEEELKEKVLERINKMRYGEKGYIFIYDLDGTCLSHYKQELVGKNRINYQDNEGRLLVQEIIDLSVKNKEGYLTYKSSVRPFDNIESNLKVSYIKSFKDWGWAIGTGFYTDALQKEIEKRKFSLETTNKESLKKIIYVSLFITIVFILISFYISKIIKNRFEEYRTNLNDEIRKTIEKDHQLIQQSKMAIMGEMIGNITHQWKQPLSLISVSNSLIQFNQGNDKTNSKEKLKKFTSNIENAVNHLSTTIDDFKNFFRPDKEKKLFKIEDVFTKTFSLINFQFTDNNIELMRNTSDIIAYGYQNELLQVMLNIFSNSKDELVKLKSGKRLVFVDVQKNESYVTISIKDNAGGIPDAIIDKVFDSYFTTKNDKEGTGIGLYMSKQIITNMSGTITVQNVQYEIDNIQYKGAEFIISLPFEE